MLKLANELVFAKEVAREAGNIMLQHFRNAPSVQVKKDGSQVSLADQEINDMLIAKVAKYFPSHNILAEEKSVQRSQATYTWVCDPIDGTLPFLLGIPLCAFSLALVDKKGQPLLAVVYDPFLDDMYWATKGSGAWKNTQRLMIYSQAERSRLFVGFSGRSSKVLNVAAFKNIVDTQCQRIATKSFVYEAVLVATGQLDAAILMGDGAHDAAAAMLIVKEAGGSATNLFGQEQRYDQPIEGLIVATPAVQKQLVAFAISSKK